jgi:hypothetical protein
MLKKPITYTDFNGDQQTDDFYFHLSKSDLAKLEITTPGGMQAFLQKIIDDQDGANIIETFQMFISMSYGIRSEDGKQFNKSRELSDAFMSSAAYDELFMELVTNAHSGVEFVQGIIPSDLARKVQDINLPEPAQPSQQELLEMSDAKFYATVGENPRNWSKDVMAIAMKRRTTQAA